MSSTPKQEHSKQILAYNEVAWDKQALLQEPWSKPVSSEIIQAAKKGQWDIHLTKKPLSSHWLPKNIQNKNILCLAAAGGQQAPVLAAAGANVTVFDISKQQLEQDKHVAVRDNLQIKRIQGDMSDLSKIKESTFDYIIHPISNLYVADLNPVWRECYRVLRRKGVLLTSFYNPVVFVFSKDKELSEKGLLKPLYTLPYADIDALEQNILNQKIENQEAFVFGHTLSSQINGQLEAGFLLAGFDEDSHPSPRFLIEKYMKTMIATRAIKF
ncbi:MAG: class I SAM-dependent methyltransferase [Legionellaceae bacterium]|nr:class I SAM-dependent methyltransferase [Legionellaceae bacterium]